MHAEYVAETECHADDVAATACMYADYAAANACNPDYGAPDACQNRRMNTNTIAATNMLTLLVQTRKVTVINSFSVVHWTCLLLSIFTPVKLGGC